MRDALKKNSVFFNQIRQFFAQRDVVEVQTPQLLNYPVTDVYIDSITMQVNQDIEPQAKYLHTSPELEMKKLLAGGSGNIYQICPVFRDNEQGAQNFNEFTMLEYYRVDFDMHQLMNEVVELLQHLGFQGEVSKLSYAQAFRKFADIDILNTDFDKLKSIAKTYGLCTDFEWIEDLQILLFTHLIEPELEDIPFCFIYDYPVEQSALAKAKGQVAQRFELYAHGIEIANGYDELQGAGEYQQRFEDEISKRAVLGKTSVDLDKDFLSSLANPLPQCSGVAIGIERLLSVK
ncbi:EF-P lysine aminoacylase EpmA [Bathymodiolus septemdierum thioautotrophic gill symbiont]|uniref:Lysyl-tRNA synthetase, class II n=1 Tax=endosymbiont of Bathymodiolus septemdierum str. Myojin knoll TaxID=1303921 RepID=A0A0P0UQJ6_9GAMM|nr:EF-P lysine aminoacylase EpmA [Bathymodiolus septemdierum thioautotrophic gill symbiont]BAS67270.1 lysyl-tRNA synthetase, class II [endosymbiont of Bathymodiolus septemdierum str. Myojin knoll]